MARHLLRLMPLLAVVLACAQVSSAKKPNPNTYTGSFTLNVRGSWTGQGTATVTQTTVQIQATVTDDAGNVGTLTTDVLNVVDGHFSGAGTVFGISLTINGRVEAKDPPSGKTGKGKVKGKSGASDEQVLTNARLGATFTAGLHGGRIAGGRD
jgi:hypothetical protein